MQKLLARTKPISCCSIYLIYNAYAILAVMNARKNGFTIVEMIIVVVIIAVLAMITVFAFNNYRARTAKTEMKNELLNAYSALRNNRNFNNTYPADQTAFNALYKPGSSVTVEYYTADGGASSYCLRVSSMNDSSKWFIGSATSQPTTTKPANCAVSW